MRSGTKCLLGLCCGLVAAGALTGCAEACGQTDDTRCDDNTVQVCRFISGRNPQWIEAFDCDDTSKICLVAETHHADPRDYCVASATDAGIPDASTDASTDASSDSN